MSNTTTNKEQYPFVKKSQLNGVYNVEYVGKAKKHSGQRGDFLSVSLLISTSAGKKAWLSLCGDDCYKVMGITSSRIMQGDKECYTSIKSLKAVKSGTYTNVYFTIGAYEKKEEATTEGNPIGDLGDFEEILSDGDVPF